MKKTLEHTPEDPASALDARVSNGTHVGQHKNRVDRGCGIGSARAAAIITAVLTVIALAACSVGGNSNMVQNGAEVNYAAHAYGTADPADQETYDVDGSSNDSHGRQTEGSAGPATAEPATDATAEPATDAAAEPTAHATEAVPAEPTAEPATAEPATETAAEVPALNSGFSVTTVDGSVTANGSTYTVKAAGTYIVTGTLADGQIIIDAGEADEIELELSGAALTCTYDSPIYAKSAGKLKIKAVEGTENVVADERTLRANEDDTTGSAAIYAECDLSLVGSGTLTVTAGYNNGVQSKDDLKLKNLTLTVTAPGNALKGNDSVTVESGTVTAISTAGDGIKTEKSDVSSKGNQRGTVTISGGTVNIWSACDGIDAAYDVIISGDPEITINTHSYSAYTASSAKRTAASNGVTKSADSSKGIKADNQVVISGGTVTVRCMDDGIHANGGVTLENGSASAGNITISGGTITLTAADDGIHADGTLLFEGGYVDVVNSHEGLEGHCITVNDGEIRVYATDDGVNATSSSGGRTSDGLITVSGGLMIVEVGGRDVDGVDSNGSYKQTGGIVIISNPNADSSGNMSALDVDSTVSVNGGVIVALGTVPGGGRGGAGGGGRFGMGGMNSGSSLPSGYVTYSGSLGAGDHTFSYGDVSVSFTLRSKVSSGWIWASGISSGNYTLK